MRQFLALSRLEYNLIIFRKGNVWSRILVERTSRMITECAGEFLGGLGYIISFLCG